MTSGFVDCRAEAAAAFGQLNHIRIGVDVVDGDDGRAGGRREFRGQATEVVDAVGDEGVGPAGDLRADLVELAGPEGDPDRIPVGPTHRVRPVPPWLARMVSAALR